MVGTGLTGDTRWGSMTPIPRTVGGPILDGGEDSLTQFQWTPGPALLPFLPNPFGIEFLRHTIDGKWQWTPVLERSGFLRHAAIAGLAIQRALGRLSNGEVYSHRAMQLLFQLSSTVRERLDYRIQNVKDLTISDAGSHHLLDINAAFQRQPAGTRKNVLLRQLLQEGSQMAEQAGAANPARTAVALAYWIDAAAQRYAEDHPLTEAEDFHATLRLALFGLDASANSIPEDLKERIAARLLDAIDSHLDDPHDHFQKWFFENYDNIVHQIAKRKKPDGPIQREIARRALLEVICDSWTHVGQCVSLCMSAVRRSISPPLTPEEDSIFTAIYCRNPYFGQIPLILLDEHFPMLQPTVAMVLHRPHDPASWVRLRRALELYAAILLARRATNLESKRIGRSPRRLIDDQVVSSTPCVADAAAQAERLEALQAILQNATTCDCGRHAPWKNVDFGERRLDGRIEIRFPCRGCGTTSNRLAELADIRRILEASGFSEEDFFA